MSYMKSDILQLRIEPELGLLIQRAVDQTGLTKSEVLRQSLQRGIPQILRTPNGAPRRTLLDALRGLKGLEIPDRRHPRKRRA